MGAFLGILGGIVFIALIANSISNNKRKEHRDEHEAHLNAESSSETSDTARGKQEKL